MKSIKKTMSIVCSVFALCFLFANVMTVHAAEMDSTKAYVNPVVSSKDVYKDNTKVRLETDAISECITVYYPTGGSVKNIKVNKKGLSAKVTGEYSYKYSSHATTYISLYSVKPGKYTVSFDVYNAAGTKLGKKKVTVLVEHNTSMFKKATFGKQVVMSSTATYKNGTKKSSYKENYKVKGTSGKFKVTANGKYKVTGLVVGYRNADGKMTYKKVKNGGKITLSKTYNYSSKSNSSSSRDYKKYTYIFVSYKDTFTGNSCTYSVTSKRGVKEVKRVYKNKTTGRTSVSYYSTSDYDYWASTYQLWQY